MALYDLPSAIRPYFEELVKEITPYTTDGNTFVAFAAAKNRITLTYKRTAWAEEFESRLLKLSIEQAWFISFKCRRERGYVVICYS